MAPPSRPPPALRCFPGDPQPWAIFPAMQGMCVVPDKITYNALISVCEKGVDLKRAAQPSNTMQRKGIKPDATTYTAWISACAKSANLKQALQLFDEMRQEGIEGDAITYSAAKSSCTVCAGLGLQLKPPGALAVVGCATAVVASALRP